MELLIATGNLHKVEEFQRILQPLGVQVLSPKDLDVDLDVEETGTTFAENARLKAEAFYRHTGKPSVADDSGLCVDALDGRPGVYSARYGGEQSTYQEKMAKLLEEMDRAESKSRSAHFVSAICCVLDENNILECEGICEGEIGHVPSGNGGFGFDPIFMVGEKSFADLLPQKKDEISHRGRALRLFAKRLEEYLKEKL